jgi:hypothetical protein
MKGRYIELGLNSANTIGTMYVLVRTQRLPEFNCRRFVGFDVIVPGTVQG